MSRVPPTMDFLVALLSAHTAAARRHAARGERGASAVEWIVIAAIVVGICIAIAAIIRAALVGEANEIGNEISNQ